MNQQSDREDEIQTQRLADLPVVEGADETKGGSDRDVDLADLNHVRNNFGITI